MIKLEHLLYTECPYCGAEVTKRDATEYEASGSIHELLEFECNCMISYSSMREKKEVIRFCSRRKEISEEIEKRDTAWNEVLEFIKERDVDEVWMRTMYDIVKHEHNTARKAGLPANRLKMPLPPVEVGKE